MTVRSHRRDLNDHNLIAVGKFGIIINTLDRNSIYKNASITLVGLQLHLQLHKPSPSPCPQFPPQHHGP